MSAIEMFNKLGFVINKNDENGFYYTCFSNEDLYIYFNKKDKYLIYNANYDGVIDTTILKAINKQIEELGWNNE